MAMHNTIKTERLILRPWQEEDLEPFAKLNADPRVREYFPGLLSRQESDQSIKLMSEHIEKCGWGFWAASLIQTGDFIGFIGLEDVNFKAPFTHTPAVEIGWRLAFHYWGRGYATEGALAALQYGFESLNLKEIVSFTPVQNQRSRHVMEKIGMHHDPKDDFDHPKLSEGHPLRRHVLYRLGTGEWQNSWSCISGTPKKITRIGVYGVAMNDGKILLIRQKQGPYAGKLDFPGGGIEFGESIEFALRREFSEEVAMEFDSLNLIENLSATMDVPETPSNGPYIFHQIGMIYSVNGCRLIEGQKDGSLQPIWIDLMTLSEEQCSKLLWKYRVSL